MDVVDDNSYTAMLLAAKMNHASVAMLILVVGCSAAVVSELGQMLARRDAVEEMMTITAQLLSPDTMNATDTEGNDMAHIEIQHVCHAGQYIIKEIGLTRKTITYLTQH